MDKNKKIIKQNIVAIVGVALVALLVVNFGASEIGNKVDKFKKVEGTSQLSSLQEKVLPSEGVEIPVSWGNLGSEMVETGVIDYYKFEEIYNNRGGLNDEDKELLYGADNGNIKITKENSGIILNLFWALGLSNKNEILEEGPMMDPKYKGAGNFASTGGWTLSNGHSMSHYSKHDFMTLTEEQQRRVENVAKGIYRPCCGNSTHFPDCNHGMAMLGLLQLMASEGMSEEKMFDVALQVNSFWFPETYLTLATYFEEKGISWDEVDSSLVLGKDYSSSGGYQKILQEMNPVKTQGGGGCSV